MICCNCGCDAAVPDKWRLINKSNLLHSRLLSANENALSLQKQLGKMTPNTRGHKLIEDLLVREEASIATMVQELGQISEQLKGL